MISKQTVREVCKVIENWRTEWSIPHGSVLALLRKLTTVKGNKSFTETIQTIRQEYFNL